MIVSSKYECMQYSYVEKIVEKTYIIERDTYIYSSFIYASHKDNENNYIYIYIYMKNWLLIPLIYFLFKGE